MKDKNLREDIAKIIHDGVTAPSGENSQPWRFLVDGNVIFVLNVVAKDTTLYNSGQHASYVSHGTCIENMVESAGHSGYGAEVLYFPSGGSNPVAKITLTPAEIPEDPLYAQLLKRRTNRNAYRPEKIPEADKRALQEEAEKTGNHSLIILDQPEQMDGLAHASAAVEQLMFQSRSFHRFFFEHFFTNRRDEHRGTGLYIDTLGLSSFEKLGIKLMRSWSITTFFRMTGIAHMVYLKRMRKYRKSGAFGIVVTDGDQAIDYVKAGRAAERVWLRATERGISLQPCGGVLYLFEGMMKTTKNVFSEEEQAIIESARNQIYEIFEIRGKTAALFFRIGYGELPAARSFRLAPEIDYISPE
ncbi:MAG: hypothetical protein Q8O53_00710 [Candidatus Moranbacteria bacterium]|nr:hypothetical protein [Candidatus Moranbacteria bacterium]